MRTRLLLTVMLMGVFFWFAALPLALAQEGTTVFITTQPDRSSGTFTLQMPATEISTTYALYLFAAAAQDNMSLSAYLQDSNQQVIANAGIEFLAATGQPLTTFNLPVGQSRIGMRISNLTQRGTFTGTIGLQSAATPMVFTPVATFTLSHPPQAQVSVKPTDAQNHIALQATSPDFYYPLTLLETGGQSDANVRLTVGPVTRKDAVAGQPAELYFDPTRAVTTSMVVPHSSYTTVALAGSLPEQTAYSSWLMVQYGDQTTIYSLDISRTVAGGVVALDAVNGQIALPMSSADFDRVLMFQVANNQPAIDDLIVALTDPPLRSDSQAVISETLTCSVCTGSVLPALNPGQIFTFTLSGRNFQATTYSSPLRLSYQGQIQSVPLVITRVQPRQTFSVTSPISVTGVNFLSVGYVDINTQIADASGIDTYIYYPASESAQLLTRDERGNLVTWSPAPTDTFLLPANGSADFTLRWSGLEAGAYTRPIRVAGPNSLPVVQSVTINVKDSIILAFSAIFLGVSASYWIQRRTRGGRTRDLRSAEIARLRQTLQSQSSDQIWSELLVRVDRLEWDNRLRMDLTDDALTATLNDLRSRAENYRQALVADKRVTELLEAFPDQTTDLQQTKREFEQEQARLLQGIQAALLLPEKQGLGSEATDAPPQVKLLHGLFDRIRQAAIRKPTEALLKQLADLAQARPDLAVEVAGWQTKAQSILSDLESGKVDDLLDRLEAIRRGYANLQLNVLDQAISQLVADRTSAPNAAVQDWQAVDTQVAAARAALLRARQLTTADEQLCGWEDARRAYLLALIEQLAVFISPAGRPSGCTEATWQRTLVEVPTLGAALERAQQAGRAGEWALAEVSYQQARVEYAKVQANLLRLRIASFKALFEQAPVNVSDEDWGEARKSLTASLAQLDEVQLLTADPVQLLTARLDFVKNQITVWNALLTWAAGHFQPDLPANWEALRQVVTRAEAARLAYEAARQTHVDIQQLMVAETSLAEAQQQYQAIRGPLITAAVAFGRPGAEPLEEVLGPLSEALRDLVATLGDLVAIPARGLLTQLRPYEELEPRTPEDWYRQVERKDRVQAALVLVVATITGLTALWINNPTFGGTNYLLAVLWGFGLNEAAQGFLKIAADNGALPAQ